MFRKMFYEKWQSYLDRKKRIPNMDYSVYDCRGYVDLGKENTWSQQWFCQV